MIERYYWLAYEDKEIWTEQLLLLPSEYRDVYFEASYGWLYENDDVKINFFIYIQDEKIFLYSFLIQEILQSPGYFDISTPYGYGGPIYNNAESGFLKRALDIFYEAAQERNIIAELIKFHPIIENQRALLPIFPGKIAPVCSTVFVDTLLDESIRWKDIYTHANRKCINKACRAEARVEFTQNILHWESFKALYGSTLISNNASIFYQFSEAYYQKIREGLSKNYILASVIFDDKIVVTLLILLGPHFTHCHLIGSDRNYMHLGFNNFLHHEVILWSKQNAFSKLHLGGGRTNAEEDSLLKFKKNFSDKLSTLYVGEHIINPPKYKQIVAEWSLANPNNQKSSRLLKYRT